MKTLLTFFLGILCLSAYGQEVIENKITKVNPNSMYTNLDFVYDSKNDEYTYIEKVDTILNSGKIISSKGNSKAYTFLGSSNILFDDEGNYYSITGNNINENSGDYYFIKNGKEIEKFNKFQGNLCLNNGKFYFIAGQGSQEFVFKYDIRNGKFEKSKGYDYIKIPYPQYSEKNYNFGNIPFTKKGKEYYVAGIGDKEVLVNGLQESKSYPQIDLNTIQEDDNGDLAFQAMMSKDEYKTKYLCYKGIEYTTDDYFGYSFAFDVQSGLPVYITGKEINDTTFQESIWRGNEKLATYDGQIYDLLISPKGKIVYTISGNPNVKNSSYVVIDGKQSQPYYTSYGILFTKNDDVIYVAASDTDKYFIVKNNEKITEDYYGINFVKLLPDEKLSYTVFPQISEALNYIPIIIVIGDKKFGPYNTVIFEETYDPYQVTSDESGNFAFCVPVSKDTSNEYYFKYILTTNKWINDDAGYVNNLMFYKNDLYYNSNITTSLEDIGYYLVFKNQKAITGKYDIIINYTFDKNKNEINFIGYKNGVYYYVEIKL